MDKEILNQIKDFLKDLSNPMNWGYFDESGCSKGAGRCIESWIGNSEHPIKKAEKLLKNM